MSAYISLALAAFFQVIAISTFQGFLTSKTGWGLLLASAVMSLLTNILIAITPTPIDEFRPYGLYSAVFVMLCLLIYHFGDKALMTRSDFIGAMVIGIGAILVYAQVLD